MRKMLSILSLLLLMSLSSGVFAQNKDSKTPAPPSEDEMMKKWKEASTPGEAHKYLDQFVGEWNVAVKMWMGGPTQPPTETTSTASVRWVLGGRFLMEEAKGQMMGMPFEGMGLTGYDNFNKKYVSSWVDNMNTALYTSQGTANGAKMVFLGKMDEPMTGERDKTVRYENEVIDKNKHIFRIYDLVGTPKEFKAVEMVYTRK